MARLLLCAIRNGYIDSGMRSDTILDQTTRDWYTELQDALGDVLGGFYA